MQWAISLGEAASDQDRYSAQIIGGKAASLATMHRLGLPVPSAFIVPTEACRQYFLSGGQFPPGFKQEVQQAMVGLQKSMARGFGAAEKPLLVSIRSGAPVSLPGMMRTILNVGATPQSLAALIPAGGVPDFALDAYRQLFASYCGRELPEDEEGGFSARARKVQNAFEQNDLADFATDAWEQLWMSIRAVLDSWNSPGALSFRRSYGVSDELGTAVIVQAMVFGNRDRESGSGVILSRHPNPSKGRATVKIEYARQQQGIAVVSGSGTNLLSAKGLRELFPSITEELVAHCRTLEVQSKNAVDVEFTIESGRLWLLQFRNASLPIEAELYAAYNLLNEGVLDDWEAARRASILLPWLDIRQFDPEAKKEALESNLLIAVGLPASPGAAIGRLAFTPGAVKGMLANDDDVGVILFQEVLDPDNTAWGDLAAAASLRGGVNCHAALVARKLRPPMPMAVGCRLVGAESQTLKEGTIVSLDGTSGEIFAKALPVVEYSEGEQSISKELDVLRTIARNFGLVGPWAAAGAAYRLTKTERKNLAARTVSREQISNFGFETEKANVVELLQRMIPQPIRVTMKVFKADDWRSVKSTMEEALDRDIHVGLRSSLRSGALGNAPWELAMDSHDLVNAFFRGDGSYVQMRRGNRQTEWGDYADWMARYPVSELIVVYNPPELASEGEDFRKQQFLITVSAEPAQASILVELKLNPEHFRSFEDTKRDDLIHIRMHIDSKDRFCRGPITYEFFASHILDSTRESLKLSELDTGQLSPSGAVDLIEPRALAIANQIRRLVFDEWWRPPIALPHTMMLLAHHDLIVLEIEGKASTSPPYDVKYILVFDAKGRDEAEQAGRITQ